MTNRQKKREEIKKAIATKYKNPNEMKTYRKYSQQFDNAKKKGYEFKEGAMDKLTKEEFDALVSLYETKAAGLVDEIPADIAIMEEHYQTSSDSIDQAISLWNNDWPELVKDYGVMTRERFREDEKFYFKELRAMYDDDAAYDLAMSY